MRAFAAVLSFTMVFAAMFGFLRSGAGQVGGSTEMVSVGIANSAADGASDQYQAISSDGRFIAFTSAASNLVAGDTNDTHDVFVRDRVAGSTELISVPTTSSPINGGTGPISMSRDGRYVAFTATTTIAGQPGVFLRDRSAGTTELVSAASRGEPADGPSELSTRPGNSQAISDDGRFVSFTSLATNLAPGTAVQRWNVFLRDRLNGTTQLISKNGVGEEANGDSVAAAINADASSIAFWSYASDIVPDDTNLSADIFVYHLATDTVHRVSIDSVGTQSNGDSASPAISADGRYIAFTSFASNLVAEDTNGFQDVFMHDVLTGETRRVVAPESNNAGEVELSIDDAGDKVAFWTFAEHLAPEPTLPWLGNIFVADRDTRAIELESIDSAGVQADSGSCCPSISGNGRFVAFSSIATNLVANDTNGLNDVFLRDRCPDGSCVTPPSATPAPTDTATATPAPTDTPVPTPTATASNKGRLLALGDSVPYGHGLADPSKNEGPSASAYPSLVADALGYRPMRLRSTNCTLSGDNLAISGAPATQANTIGFEKTCACPKHQVCLPRAVSPDELEASRLGDDPARVVIIQAGADDIHFAECVKALLRVPGAQPCIQSSGSTMRLTTTTRNQLASFEFGLGLIIRQVRRQSPTARVILVNYYQPAPTPSEQIVDDGSTLCTFLYAKTAKERRAIYDGANLLQSSLNSAIQRVASREGVAVADMSRAFDGHEACTAAPAVFNGLWKALHPTAQGHQAIASRIESLLRGS